jgi:hypothetical protein
MFQSHMSHHQANPNNKEMLPEEDPCVAETCCNTERMYKFNDILNYLTNTFSVLNIYFWCLLYKVILYIIDGIRTI